MNLRRKTKTAEVRSEDQDLLLLGDQQKVIDTTVIGYVDASPQESVESTRSYVLTGMQAALERDQEDLVRWWVEDEGGKSSNSTTISHHRPCR
jgi:hypothetical protein